MPFIAVVIALFGLVFSIYMAHVVSNLSNIVNALRYINTDINHNDNSDKIASSLNNLVKLSVLKEANRMEVLSDEEYEVLLTEILDEFDHSYIYDVPFKDISIKVK